MSLSNLLKIKRIHPINSGPGLKIWNNYHDGLKSIRSIETYTKCRIKAGVKKEIIKVLKE
jgi:hypothetical protein